MAASDEPGGVLLESLQKKAKELSCIYQIGDILRRDDEPLDDIFAAIVQVISDGWPYPEGCSAEIVFEGTKYASVDFVESRLVQSVAIPITDKTVGKINIYCRSEQYPSRYDPDSCEKSKLLQTITNRLGNFIEHRKVVDRIQNTPGISSTDHHDGNVKWKNVMNALAQSDKDTTNRIARKLLNYMCMRGVIEAEKYLPLPCQEKNSSPEDWQMDRNTPYKFDKLKYSRNYDVFVFQMAAKYINDETIEALITKWVLEEKLSYLDQTINSRSSLVEVAQAIRRHYPAEKEKRIPSSAYEKGVQVSLVRRFLSDQLQYVNTAKHFISVNDIYNLLENVICASGGRGKIGGKGAGMYLAAKILKKCAGDNEVLKNVKIPKTWHISADTMSHFVRFNGFEDVVEQKYKENNQIKIEYPYIIQTFKNASFPAEIVHGLSVALDDLGKYPLIVRSSSLLEDRAGAAFSGKYKSLFLANQGEKNDRLEALLDAVAEIYASTFNPDAIEYRAERGLLDYVEEMGIMIQQVVGTKIGRYYLPHYAGVAFSRNEFRWSPRIRPEDGLARLVPGLGTRAVNRMSNDYPVLLAPGQPRLKVNATIEETVNYSPRMIDVINMETNRFETKDLREFIAEVGSEIKGISDMVSVRGDINMIRPASANIDFNDKNLLVTFDGLLTRTPFVKLMKTMLGVLEDKIGLPVDIEFCCDGKDLYLLQCRPQSSYDKSVPIAIPRAVPKKHLIFSANRFISQGLIKNITHIVYVSAREYEKLSSRKDLLAVGQAVGKLNRILPKRQFVLMGPGRWGSKGDVKLGISVGYGDINNTAVLIEVAHQKGEYVPDLSFGTHFFQDMVEANIHYIPIYPDNAGTILNDNFLEKSQNILGELLPEYKALSDTVRVIDIPKSTGGMTLEIFMNADLEEAKGILRHPHQ